MGSTQPERSRGSVDFGLQGLDGLSSAESGLVEALITSRQNISPKRLAEPGPNQEQQERLFRAAAAAPDHGLLRPWRFVIVPQRQRSALAETFALALIERDPSASQDQIESAREKAYRAPLLMLVVARLGECEPPIPVLERMIAVGCAVQNILLSAHGMAYGSSLTSGQAIRSTRMRELFRLEDGEEAVCFINIGTVSKRKVGRVRPAPTSFVSQL